MREDLTGVKAGYDRWAAIYDHDGNPLQALEGPVVRAAVGEPAGLDVLDLGCGTGRHSLWLAANGARVTAVDFSEGMLAQLRTKPGGDAIRVVVRDLHESLPFSEASFDRVVSGLVLEHLRELGPLFGEMHRVLRPGGCAVISAMHPALFLRDTQAQFMDPESGELVRPGSVPHSISAFVLAAVEAGFQIRNLMERGPDESIAARYPRAAKYIGWPSLVVMVLEKQA